MSTIYNIYWVKDLLALAGVAAFIASLVDKQWANAAKIIPMTALLWLLGYGFERLWLYFYARSKKRDN